MSGHFQLSVLYNFSKTNKSIYRKISVSQYEFQINEKQTCVILNNSCNFLIEPNLLTIHRPLDPVLRMLNLFGSNMFFLNLSKNP